jgi:hypothetical protein
LYLRPAFFSLEHFGTEELGKEQKQGPASRLHHAYRRTSRSREFGVPVFRVNVFAGQSSKSPEQKRNTQGRTCSFPKGIRSASKAAHEVVGLIVPSNEPRTRSRSLVRLVEAACRHLIDV